MKEAFISRRFQKATLVVIEQANAILGEYQRLGFVLTLRQLFYQFVARALLGNTERSYKNLGSVVTNARLAGLIDWAMIEDRTRELNGGRGGWDGTTDFIADMIERYAEDPWENQPYRPEVWIEKTALLGVIEGVCSRYGVRYYASRGDDAIEPASGSGVFSTKVKSRSCCTLPTTIRVAFTSPARSATSWRCSLVCRSRCAASG